MSVKIDLKKFKHVSSDDKSTTLKHKDGHEFKILHGKMGKDFQAQLDALKEASKPTESTSEQLEAPQQMAEGGLLDKAGQFLDNAADKAAGTKYPQRKPASEPVKPGNVKKYGFDKAFAEGGSVDEKDLQFDPFKETHAPKPEERLEAIKADPELDRIATAGQMFDMGTKLPDDTKESMAIDQLAKERQDVTADAAWRKVDQTTDAVKQAEENKRRQAAGLQPVLTQAPDIGGAPQYNKDAEGNPLAQPTSEGTSPVQPQGLATTNVLPAAPQHQQALTGLDQQIAGINKEAAVARQLAAAQQKVLDKQLKDGIDLQNDYKTKFDAINAERQALEQDVKDGHVDPNKYWTGDPKTGEGGHSKIMSAIGMIVAGFQPMGGPNAAINFLEKQMEANLNAQKANLNSKENLLASNMKQFGNLKDAMEATRIQQRDMATIQLQQAVNSVQSPLAKAKAMQEIGKLQATNAAASQKLAGSLTLNNMYQEANRDPSKIDGYMQTLKQYDPKAWADAQDTLIPGKGFATSKEGAKVVRESQQVTNTVMDGVNKLREIMKRPMKSMSLNDRAEAETIRNALVGSLRVPITGPGAMNEGERELLLKIIPDVTSLTTMDSISQKKLDTVAERIQSSYDNTLRANGLHVAKAATKQAPMSAEGKDKAVAWAKANPQDPRSAKILKALGQ